MLTHFLKIIHINCAKYLINIFLKQDFLYQIRITKFFHSFKAILHIKSQINF